MKEMLNINEQKKINSQFSEWMLIKDVLVIEALINRDSSDDTQLMHKCLIHLLVVKAGACFTNAAGHTPPRQLN